MHKNDSASGSFMHVMLLSQSFLYINIAETIPLYSKHPVKKEEK